MYHKNEQSKILEILLDFTDTFRRSEYSLLCKKWDIYKMDYIYTSRLFVNINYWFCYSTFN